MNGDFALSMRMKKFFFDRQMVIDRMGKANRRSLSKVGAFIRRRARSSLRRRKRVSRPGEPPSVHSSDRVANLKNILFAYEPTREALVIGPVKLNQVNQSWIDFGVKTLPQVMEFGDAVLAHERSRDGGKTWRRRDLRYSRRRGDRLRKRRVIYRPRPFMGPALAKERDNIPDAWAGSL